MTDKKESIIGFQRGKENTNRRAYHSIGKWDFAEFPTER